MAYQLADTLTDKKQNVVILFINKLWVNSVPIFDDRNYIIGACKYVYGILGMGIGHRYGTLGKGASVAFGYSGREGYSPE
ncbi:MAG: hypothetical protein HFJ06_17655 [Lachnospiraceae bacterium]|nr:hypothetical protein [Lachnospiraceae bacterium]